MAPFLLSLMPEILTNMYDGAIKNIKKMIDKQQYLMLYIGAIKKTKQHNYLTLNMVLGLITEAYLLKGR